MDRGAFHKPPDPWFGAWLSGMLAVLAALVLLLGAGTAQAQEVITFSPTSVNEGATKTITVTGSGFPAGATAALIGNDNTTCPTSAITIPSGTSIPISGGAPSGSFSVTGKAVSADTVCTPDIQITVSGTNFTFSGTHPTITVKNLPTVSISGGPQVTEGGQATFTVTASPAPASALTVNLTIAQTGAFVNAGLGSATVTVPTSGSATYSVATVNDNTDEPNGSVTATLAAGTGYSVHGTQGSASVAVNDNDGAPSPTSAALVKNTGQATEIGTSDGLDFDWATAFTTGGSAAGYVLTRVDIPFQRARPAQVAFSVSIRSSSGGNPGASLGALTLSGTLSPNADNTFTASGGGIALAANTTYFLVIDVTDDDIGTEISTTASGAEDTGGAAGWSIADVYHARRWDSSSWHVESTETLKFSVQGYARTRAPEAPRASRAQALKKTLAAVASRTVASALGHIDARFGDAVPSGNLTLAGRTVNLAAKAPDAYDNCTSDGFDRGGFDRGAPGCGDWSRSLGTNELLYGSAFSIALGAAEGDADPGLPRWSVWGRGDYAAFEGSPRGIRYDGKARTGWLGVDAREDPWVAGLALSHGVSEANYGYDGGGDIPAGTGRLETTLTALYPYGRWTLEDGLELRGVLGVGTGEARHDPGGGARETGDLGMRMGSVGVRKELPPFEGIDLAARADAGTVTMKVDDGPGAIGGISAGSWRLRLGLEASRRFAMDENDTALTPFVEAAARRDGGDGLAGTGLEVAGGVRYAAPGVEIEARGRMLAAHTEDGAREHGMSVTARVGPGAQGRGLSLSLAPRWGAPAGNAQALWRDEMPQPSENGNQAAMEARIGYGFAPSPGGLLTPFAETGLAGGGETRRLRLGTRLDAPRMGLGAELSGERRERATADPGHAVRLDLELRF